MHIHILGICGTFMGGIALLARQLGMDVSGSDANVYPPMSTQLQQQGINLSEGYDPKHLQPEPDLVVIGNALSRGNPAVEYVLNSGLPYMSGPAFLAQYVLHQRWVLGVAGTHGKTTTASMLAWILEDCGMQPGFLIGGVSQNFPVSARLGELPFFVVEADEYDSAFFDKRSKFIHYRPRTLVLNNLEFDHADIFNDLDDIKRQFHHLIRTVPATGLIIHSATDSNLDDVIAQGCWTPLESFRNTPSDQDNRWNARNINEAGVQFDVYLGSKAVGTVNWSQIGHHNVHNGLAAIAAARHAGIPAAEAIRSLSSFQGVKRRMELRATVNHISVYDDFAHHPTAIATTLEGLRYRVNGQRIIALLEPRSNTMRMGIHINTLAPALAQADEVILYQPPGLDWALDNIIAAIGPQARLFDDSSAIIDYLAVRAQPGDHILIMSNGGFDNIHQRLIDALQEKYGS
jgi:UDP-N-acetylmuramate: L-alanyl-gamma-D-glutamyl-meso-diaminopimelate ligase